MEKHRQKKHPHLNGRIVPGECDLTLTHSGVFFEQDSFKAGTIQSIATMEAASDITYQAGNYTELQPGFEVALGATFTVEPEPCASTGAWVYQYSLSDHLGNNRILFADLNGDDSVGGDEILQENHYYAFGMEMAGDWQDNTVSPEHRYRYNGKELNEELGLYDYGARWYDPSIARWGQVDPLALKYSHLSPYNYVNNNPVLLIDPDGREFVNPYSDFSQYSGQRQELQDAVNSAKESGEKSDLRSAKKALRKFDRSGEGQGLSAYNEVEGILSSFKEAVGEDIYNHFDNLTFQGSDIDIVVNLSSQNNDSGDNQDAQTVIPYSVGQSTDFTTGKTSYYATGITDNTINITLFATGRDLSSFANEMGDVKFGTERSQAVLDDRNLPYDDQRSTQYSRAYEWWVTNPKSGGEPKVNEY